MANETVQSFVAELTSVAEATSTSNVEVRMPYVSLPTSGSCSVKTEELLQQPDKLNEQSVEISSIDECPSSNSPHLQVPQDDGSNGISLHDLVNSANSAIELNSSVEQVQVISDASISSVTDSNGAVYLLVSTDDNSGTHNVQHQQNDQNNMNSVVMNTNGNEPKSNEMNLAEQTVQIMNSDGIPININVNELLSTVISKPMNSPQQHINSTSGNILSLSSSIISTTDATSSIQRQDMLNHAKGPQYIIADQSSISQISSIPSWALHLRDCTLFGDTYTGYVTDENEMDTVLNLYKKETQSLFAIRQTPSPAKDESSETVRLMWKSQYVPYDGIPFVNVGRRATVMECEHGPRKRTNALKRLMQMHGHKSAMKKIPNLTCPARLFVKKVRKFPQYRVPVDADAKLMRQLQEQSLKSLRHTGFKSGEIRLYMQLPLPSAHRYHNIGTSIEAFQREIEDDEINVEPIAVDGSVLEKIQEIVRQGFSNPFVVRAAVKDFVENKMSLDNKPMKHNKAFYPPLIEIQNIIQQTQAALNTGMIAPLPAPAIPPVPPRQKRKRNDSAEVAHSPIYIKRMKIDAAQADDVHSSTMVKPTDLQSSRRDDESTVPLSSTLDPSETISLTLTDSQLQDFSVQNFTYDQLAQLAKIGLLALNNAAKDTDEGGDEKIQNSTGLIDPADNGQSCSTTLLEDHSVENSESNRSSKCLKEEELPLLENNTNNENGSDNTNS